MMRIRKLKNGFRVFPSWGGHHKSKLKLRQLLNVHEYGATIKRGSGNNITLIRIPPRPARLLAYKKYMTEFKKRQVDKDIKKAISQYIKNADKNWIKKKLEKEEAFFNKLLEE